MMTVMSLLELMLAFPGISRSGTVPESTYYRFNAQTKNDTDPMLQLLHTDSFLSSVSRFVERVRTTAGKGLHHQEGVFALDVQGLRVERSRYPDLRGTICCQLGEYVKIHLWQDMFLDGGVQQSQGALLAFQMKM